ncbi:O-antigen polysaccharide polymerase Wzy, partial [Streptococcus pneumoniae]
VSHTGFWDILLDFIYKQGTSFGVLARGFLFNSSLPYRDFRNFTFGPVLDYFA